MASFSLASSSNIAPVSLSSGVGGTIASHHDPSNDFMLMTDTLLFDDQLTSSFFMPGMFDSFDCNFDLSTANLNSNGISSKNETINGGTIQQPNHSISSNETRPVEYFGNSSMGEISDMVLASSNPNDYCYQNGASNSWNAMDRPLQYQSHLFSNSTDNLGMGSSAYPMGSNPYFRHSSIFGTGHHSGINSPQNTSATIKVPISTHKTNISSEIKRSTPLMLPFHHKNDNRIIPVRNFSAQHQVAAAAAYLASSASFTPSSTNGVYSPNISSNSFLPSSPFQITLSIGDIQSTKKDFLKRAEEIDYSNVTVVELKNFLREFHQASGGKKADLMERIRYICNYLRGEEVAINSSPSVQNTQSMGGGIYSQSSQLPSYNFCNVGSPQMFSSPISLSQTAIAPQYSYYK